MDLNLLVALDALLETESVTVAAERVFLSQPAMSRALGRLRDHLGDPLLVREGQRMVPTPFAKDLRPRLRDVLHQVERLLRERESFDPASAEVCFRMSCLDLGQFVFLPAARKILKERASGVQVVVQRYVEPYEKLLETSDTDLVISARLPHERWVSVAPLFENRMVCLAARSNPWLKAPSLASFVAHPHLMVSPSGEGPDQVDHLLAAQGLTRQVSMRVPDYVGAVGLAAQSDLLLVIPENLAQRATELLDVEFHPLPLSDTTHTVYMMWHESRTNHAPLTWFRKTTEEAILGEMSRLQRGDSMNSFAVSPTQGGAL
jgi:DNA-binding transcriptional LysR family regulator